MATTKKVNDKSEIGGSYMRIVPGTENLTLFSFYSRKKSKKRIIVASIAFLDAIELLRAFNPWFELEYDVTEYKEEFVETWIYLNICNIPIEYKFTPRFISEKEYKELSPYIDNKGWANTHHTKAITQNNNKKIFGNESAWIDRNVQFNETIRKMTQENELTRNKIIDFCKNNDLIYKEGNISFFDRTIHTNLNVIIVGTNRKAISNKINEYNNNCYKTAVLTGQGKEQYLFNSEKEIDMNDVRLWNKIEEFLPEKITNDWAKIFFVTQISNLPQSTFSEDKVTKEEQ